MILLIAMLQAAAAVAAAAPAPSPEDIVILGRRLQQVQVHMDISRKGELRRCEVTKSVGDPALDRFWCDAGRACAQEVGRKRSALQTCMEARKDEFLDALAASRAAHSQEAHPNAQN